ncbi:MAG TPA: TonB-dependent receptor [Bryobacteraceae bacterium]|nr:TonB-dependent receptor [Bryobacteraceae bacterium]
MYRKLFALRFLTTALCAFVLLAVPAAAQVQSGAILGAVYDQSGAVIPGVTVRATNKATAQQQTTMTGGDGLYNLPSLPYGEYSVEAGIQGFQTARKDLITLHADTKVKVDFTLSPGSVDQTIEVTGEAVLLQTEEGELKNTIYRNQVENLPLNSRSPTDLVLLAPSAQVSGQASSGSSLGFNFNGLNSNAIVTNLDGTDNGIGTQDGMMFGSLNFNLVLTSLDSIQEFDIATGNYSADVRGAGGYLNVITKTGTNNLHFSVFEFFRNGKLDARNFFANRPSTLKQNTFGGTVTGPILRQKTFFMASYEGQRIRLPFPGVANVPTASFRSRTDSRLKPFLDLTPLPTDAIPGNADVGIYRSSVQQLTRQDLLTARLDHNFSQKVRLFARYTINDGVVSGAFPTSGNELSIFPGFGFNQPVRHQSATVGYTHTFTPTLLNELRVGLNRYLEKRVRGPQEASQFFIPRPSVPGVLVGGGGNIKKFGNTSPEFNEKMTWIRGRNTLSFGGNYSFLATGQNQSSATNMTFANLAGFQANAPVTLSNTFGASMVEGPEHFSIHEFGFFVQDDFRATSRLTLNIGMRYDNFGVISESKCRGKNVISDPLGPFRAPCQPLYERNNKDFGPRFGLAWQPFGKSLVFRGGYGIFYSRGGSLQQGDLFNLNNSFPFTLTTVDFPNLSYPFDPRALALTSGIPGRYLRDPFSKDLYSQQWNLTAEYQIGQATTFSAGYVGNHQINIPGADSPNAIDPFLGRRPNALLGNVALTTQQDNGWYNALQTSVRRRLAKGLAWDVFYTWAHSNGVESGLLQATAGIGLATEQIQNLKNRRASRGNTSIDIRHRLTTDLTYELPKLAHANGAVRAVLGGWSTSGIMKVLSGTPFNVISGQNEGNFRFQQRPNLVLGIPTTIAGVSPADGFVNRAAFAIPTFTDPATRLTLGNLGNNVIRTRPSFFMDWSVAKRFGITDKLNTDFRAEFFNIMNHPVFANPINNLASGTLFGKSQAARDARQIQLMLRFNF